MKLIHTLTLRMTIGLALASATCGLMAWHPTRALAAGDNAAASQPSAYSQSISEHYNYRFGADKPFLPSYASTETGEFLSVKSFPSAAYCGHCHQEAHAEWRQSVHANSFRAPWYVKNVNVLMNTKGIEFARHCEGCHNPIALTSGSMTKNSPVDRKFDVDGITCSVCHSMVKVDTRGTGSYVLARPAVIVDAEGKPVYGEVSD